MGTLCTHADQCASFRRALRETGTKKIVHSTYRGVDLYWGTGLDYRDVEGARRGDYPGKDVLGKLLMKVRDTLQDESAYKKPDVEIADLGDVVLCLEDGESIPASVMRRHGVGKGLNQSGKVTGQRVLGGKQNFSGSSGFVTSLNVMKPPVLRKGMNNVPGGAKLSPPMHGAGPSTKTPFRDLVESYRASKRLPLLNTKPSHYGNRQNVASKCFKCGEVGHSAKVCRFRTRVVCFSCHCLGHKRKHCVSVSVPTSTAQHGAGPSRSIVSAPANMATTCPSNDVRQGMHVSYASVTNGAGRRYNY